MIPPRLRLLNANVGPLTDDAWERRLAELKSAVAQTRAQILGLQGASQAQALQLARSLEGFTLCGGQRKWVEGARQACLMVKSEDVEVLRVSDIPLGEAAPGVGVASMATVGPTDSKRRIIIASVDTDPEQSRRRLDDIAAVLRAVEAASPDPRMGRVVMGAFYETPDQVAYRILTGRRTHRGTIGDLRDTFRRVRQAEPDGLRGDWIMANQVEVQESHLVMPPPVEGQGARSWESLHHRPVFAELLL